MSHSIARHTTISLIRLLRAAGHAAHPRRRVGRIPRPTLPTAIERAYHDAIVSIVNDRARACVAEVEHEILTDLARHRLAMGHTDASTRSDASPEEERALFLLRRAAQRFTDGFHPHELHDLARRMGGRLDDHARAQLEAQLRAAIGIPLSGIERPVRDRIEGWAAQNVDLIRTIPERYFDRLRAVVEAAYAVGRRPELLQEDIAETFEISVNDAGRIARDQLGKLNADVTQARHEALGVTHYIWRTVRDQRVRSNHRHLDGVRCAYDEPPMGGGTQSGERGHPGSGIECRCYAEPVLDEIIKGVH